MNKNIFTTIKRLIFTLSMALIVIFTTTSLSKAQEYTITQLTNNSYDDRGPHINDNGIVVWAGFDHGTKREIFLYDGHNIRQLTNDSYDDWVPDINDAGVVVWQRYDGNDWEIFLYNGTTTTRLTDNSYNDTTPYINNSNVVVWSGHDGNDWEIFLYNNTSITQITDNSYDDSFPYINDNGYVVWYGSDGNDEEIFLYDGHTVNQLTNNSYHDFNPYINKSGVVVWYGYDGNDTEIFLYDGSTIIQFTDNTYYDQNPYINDNGEIVWYRQVGNNNEIYLYNGTTTAQLTDNTYNDRNPKINNTGVVVWTGFDGNDYEIFLAKPIHVMLDEWIDNRWSGDTPQALIQAINAAGLEISDVEELLLKGRAAYPIAPQSPGQITTDLPIDAEHLDHSSEYLIYVPSNYKRTTQTPLIVVGHGGSSCRDIAFAEQAASGGMSPWKHFAEQHGFLMVAPLTDRGWGQIGYSVLFSTLSQVKRDYNVDPNRIYLTGHSMGGHLSWRSGIYLGDRWAAISPMSGGYDYVATKEVENLFNVPGFATWGENDYYGIEKHNRKISGWMKSHGFHWANWEKPGGGHDIFSDYIYYVGNMFVGSTRNLYRNAVFASVGPGIPTTLQWETPEQNACWGVTHTWLPQRPIPASTFHWLRLKPGNTDQRVWAVNKGNNTFEITSENTREFCMYLHPQMVDFSRSVVVKVNGETVFNNVVEPDLATMLNLVREFDDRGRVYHAAIDIAVSTDEVPPAPNYLVNDKVSFQVSKQYPSTTDTAGCPGGCVGKDSFDAYLSNKVGSPFISDLLVKVKTLTNGNLLQNANGGPGGEGAMMTVSKQNGYSDGVLIYPEGVNVHFVFCLKNWEPFEFFVDVLGIER